MSVEGGEGADTLARLEGLEASATQGFNPPSSGLITRPTGGLEDTPLTHLKRNSVGPQEGRGRVWSLRTEGPRVSVGVGPPDTG